MSEYPYIFDEQFDHVLGDGSAPVTVVAYESYSCPHCRDFMVTVFPRINSEYIQTGKVRYILREVFSDKPGLLAAAMLRAVPEKRFFVAVEELYAEQKNWLLAGSSLVDVERALIEFGADQGSDEAAIVDNLNSAKLQKSLAGLSEAHITAGAIKGAPTLVIDGAQVRDWSYVSLSQKLDAQLLTHV